MDIRAIVLAGIPSDSNPTSRESASTSRETFSGVPLAFLPVLGRPVIHRIVDYLKKSGIDSISVLRACSSVSPMLEDFHSSDVLYKEFPSDQVWRAAEDEFENVVQAGAELVILVRVGAYAEVELDPLVQFHLEHRNHITQATAPDGPIDFFMLSGSHRNDVAFLFRHKLRKSRVQGDPFETHGYVNRLRTPADLRSLALDSLMKRTSIEPFGKEFRPGVWVGAGARVARNVRLVAPCYIGPSSKIRAGALVTRGSSIEHHCVVDCGSVIEASTMLPLSYLGIGLDLAHSVVGSRRVFNVKHGGELEVEDATLISTLPETSVLRTLHHAANLLAFVPRQMVRSFLGERKQRESQIDSKCPPSGSFEPAAVARPVPQERVLSSSVVAGMREYGNQ